ncbi:MAG: uroporphyrinogen decarboxylase family protein [Eubacteriales bacterium]|nr:uroporphyrinogen decarboxylase family protein [Eubacteriales bacterium]
MTGKELVIAAFQHADTPRAPWVPFAGIHAGKLKGYNAQELLTDGEKLVESLREVHRLYVPDGMPIVFDLQLEAEILGCDLMWSENNPPSVTSHPLANQDEMPDKFVEKTDGRVPLILDACRKMKAEFGDKTALYGLFCGPFTLASHLAGTRLFKDMKKNPEYVHKIMDYCTKNALRMIDYYAETGMDIVAPVDPLVSQISPKAFEEYLAGPYSELFKHIREKGLHSSFFVCGNALPNIENMCKTNPDGISIDENIPMATAKEITDRYNLAIGGNIPLTTTMLFGNQQDNMKFVVDMVGSVARKNLIVSPGCDMPYDVPLENVIAVAEAVRDIDKYRELLKNYESAGVGADVELPDYANAVRPYVEAYTLDSASCAACTYMWAVVNDAKDHFGDRIEIAEYKYTTKDGIARSKKLGVANLPSVYINGELAYASVIPNQEEFFRKIESYIK